MKILEVIEFLSPIHGGSSRSTYEVSKRLSTNRNEVVVYTSNFKLSQTWVKRLFPAKVYPFSVQLQVLRFLLTFGLIKKSQNDIKSFDLVHMHNYRSFQNVIVAHYAMKYKVPYVLQAHGSLPIVSGKSVVKKFFDIVFGYKLLNNATMVIAINPMEAQQYRLYGIPNERIATISNGVDLSRYETLPIRGSFRKRLGIANNDLVVLFLGRIHKIKGIDILVKAFAAIADKLDNVKFVIAGPDDGYLHEVESLIRTLKIADQVLIVGPLFGNDKLQAFIDADVYVLPSRYEIFGLTLVESIACRTPVILTDACGAADYFRNKVGLVVETGSESDLERALLQILTNNKVREMFKDSCKNVVRAFDISATTAEIERLFEEIVIFSKR